MSKALIDAMRSGTAEDICRVLDTLMEGDWDGLEPVDVEASIAEAIVAARLKPGDATFAVVGYDGVINTGFRQGDHVRITKEPTPPA